MGWVGGWMALADVAREGCTQDQRTLPGAQVDRLIWGACAPLALLATLVRLRSI